MPRRRRRLYSGTPVLISRWGVSLASSRVGAPDASPGTSPGSPGSSSPLSMLPSETGVDPLSPTPSCAEGVLIPGCCAPSELAWRELRRGRGGIP